jgi:hypothetical protein
MMGVHSIPSHGLNHSRNFASTKAASLRLLLLHSEVRGALDEEEEEEEEEEAEAEEVT